MKRSIVLAVALASAAALGLSGCGNGGGQSGSTSGSASNESLATPLDKYRDAMWGGTEMTEESYAAENKAIQEIIASCMADEGFDYIPDTVNQSVAFASDTEDEIDYASLEFAQEYGYSIASWPGMDETSKEEPEEYVDPNQKYYSSLSASEQKAYDRALNGRELTEEEMNSEDFEYDWSNQGCWGQAYHELYGEQAERQDPYQDPDYADLLTQMDSIYEKIYEGAEKKELDQQWASCMTEAGFANLEVDNAQNSLYDEYAELMGYESEKPATPAQADIDAFKAKEIKQAVADWKCRDKIKYDDAYTKLVIDAEQKFVDEHKAELDAMASKYAVAQSS